MIKRMAKENISSKMGDNILDSLKRIKCMAKVNTGGPMEDTMKESINKTKNTDRVSLFGKMAESMMANGKMENKKPKRTQKHTRFDREATEAPTETETEGATITRQFTEGRPRPVGRGRRRYGLWRRWYSDWTRWPSVLHQEGL